MKSFIITFLSVLLALITFLSVLLALSTTELAKPVIGVLLVRMMFGG